MFHQAIACLYAITKTLWSWTVAGQNHSTLASRLEAAEKRLAETTHPWMHQVVKFDFTADLTGIGNRSVRVICDV